MATLDQIEQALRRAHEAGDVDNARRLAAAYKEMQSSAPEDTNMSIGDVATGAIKNFPESAYNVAKGAVSALIHPIDTTQAVLNLGNSALQKALPESVNDFMHTISPRTKGNVGIADKFVDLQKQRYGGIENIKKTISEDPAGVAADLSALIGGTGALISKMPKLASTGAKVTRAAGYLDPVTGSLRVAGKVVPKVGKVGAAVLGQLTGTGSDPIKTAAITGMKGGDKASDFIGNLRDTVPQQNVLDDFKKGLEMLHSDMTARYREGIKAISKDPDIIPFDSIDDAVKKSLKIGRYKDKITNKSASGVMDEISSVVHDWKTSNPADYHTAEGLDALKKAIGDIRSETKFGTSSRTVANNVYHAIKDEIIQKFPDYGRIMKDYEEGSKKLEEITKAFSLGEKASADTSMRKLQSLMRNNVNTNYGNRARLADELQNFSGLNLKEKIAGQALNSITPRGLQGALSGGIGAYGIIGQNPSVIPVLAMQSPRVVGELSHGVGKGYGLLSNTAIDAANELQRYGINPGLLSVGLYEANDLGKNASSRP